MAGSGGGSIGAVGAVGGAMSIGGALGAVSPAGIGALNVASSGHNLSAQSVKSHEAVSKANGSSHINGLMHSDKIGVSPKSSIQSGAGTIGSGLVNSVGNPVGNKVENSFGAVINGVSNFGDCSVTISPRGLHLSQDLDRLADDLVALALLAILEKDERNNNPAVNALTAAVAIQMYQDVTNM